MVCSSVSAELRAPAFCEQYQCLSAPHTVLMTPPVVL